MRASVIGDEPSQPNFTAIATDEKGNLFATQVDNQVAEFYANGARVSFGSNGMDHLLAIGVDSHNNIYVLRGVQPNASILEFGAGGTGKSRSPTATIAGSRTGLTNPVSIALDSQDNIYVVNRVDQAANAQILEFAAGADGNVAPVRTIAGDQTGLYAPTAVAVDPKGTTYVANDGNQAILDNGTLSGTVPSSVSAYAASSNGNAKPALTIAGGATGIILPGALMFDGDGDLWVSSITPPHPVSFQGLGYASGAVVFTPGSRGNAKPVYQFFPNTLMFNKNITGEQSLQSPTGLALAPHASVGPMAYVDAAPPPPPPPPPPAETTQPVSVGAIGIASAASSGTLLYSTDFSSFDPAWGTASYWASVASGSMVLKAAATQHQTWRINTAHAYRNAEFHMKLRPTAGTTSEAGLIFWATSFAGINNCQCWSVAIDSAGSISVEQFIGPSESGYTSGFVRSPAIKPGADGWYDLDVRLDGVQGIVSVNGTQVVQFPARAPDYGGLIGLQIQSAGTWEFSGLTATSVAPASAPPDPP
jgi:hypothetical protein